MRRLRTQSRRLQKQGVTGGGVEEGEAFLCMAGEPDTVKASLGGETVEVLLDTGSKPFSFISKAGYEKHKKHLLPERRKLYQEGLLRELGSSARPM